MSTGRTDKPDTSACVIEGRAAYLSRGMQAINPYDPTKFPDKHDAWQQGRAVAHREAFERRQRMFMERHA